MTSQQGATFGHRLRLNSWFLGIGRSDPVEEVSPSPHHSCGIYFLPTSDFSTMNINFSGRDLKLIICNSLFCATEDLCHQCELYYYYYPMFWQSDPWTTLKFIKKFLLELKMHHYRWLVVVVVEFTLAT